MNEMKIPDESDWEDFDPRSSIDTDDCHYYYFGKSNSEMRESFERNVVLCGNGLRFMPIKPFQYYVLGFRDYVLNMGVEIWGRSDAASVYLNVILNVLEKKPAFVIPIFDQLKDSINYVAENQALYDADQAIYGSFIERRKKIFQLAGQH
ncbi:hypothetical protein [Methyloglobulus sp.]|uniref:hypothetical protein n=1 Tax=Methyloglobulus sp. TaxID=2518622 RepID=UPI0032B81803